MKKLLFLFMLLPFIGIAQKYQDPLLEGKRENRFRSDSVFQLPIGLTGSNNGLRTKLTYPVIPYGYDTGQVRYNSIDSSIRVWTGFQWLAPGGSGSSISFPYTTNKYLTGYNTFGSLPDSVRSFLLANSPITYNSGTGVLGADTSILATQFDISSFSTHTLQQVFDVETGEAILTKSDTINNGDFNLYIRSTTVGSTGGFRVLQRSTAGQAKGDFAASGAGGITLEASNTAFDEVAYISMISGDNAGTWLYALDNDGRTKTLNWKLFPDSLYIHPNPTDEFNFIVKGIPDKASLAGTDSVIIHDINGKIWKVPSSAIGGYTDEQAQDAVGTILTDGNTIDFTYNDATPSIVADVKTQMSLTSDASGIKLSGDAASPGNLKYYGTNLSGTKGFFDLAGVSWSGILFSTNTQSTSISMTTHNTYDFDGSSPATFTLPSLSTSNNRLFFIKNRGSATLTIARDGTDNIYTTSSVTSFTIAPGEHAIVRAHGTTIWVVHQVSSGDITGASNVGGGLSNFSAENAGVLEFNTFNASDFDLASNVISIDYVNGQKASASLNGFVSTTTQTFAGDKTFNGRLEGNILDWNLQSIATSAGTTTLTATSVYHTIFTGTTTQTIKLPDATSLTNGNRYKFTNNSTGTVSITNNGDLNVYELPGGGTSIDIYLKDNGTSNGTWDFDYKGITYGSQGIRIEFQSPMAFNGGGEITDLMTFPTVSATIAATNVAQTWTAGIKPSFDANGTNADIRLIGNAGDPSTLQDGDIWYNSTTGKFRIRQNGVSSDMQDGAGSGSPGGSDKQVQYNNAGAFGGWAGLKVAQTNLNTEIAIQATTEVGLLMTGIASQTADFWQAKNSGGTTLASLSKDGYARFERLGIGVDPTSPLNIESSSSFPVGTPIATFASTSTASTVNINATQAANLVLYGGASDNRYWILQTDLNQGSGLRIFEGFGAQALRIQRNSGNPLIMIGSGTSGSITPAAKLEVKEENATTNAVNYNLLLSFESSGTPATGIGVGTKYKIETASGNYEEMASIGIVTTDVTSTSEDADIVFGTMKAGAAITPDLTITNGTIKIANVTQDDTETKILVWNSTDDFVQWRDASTLGGGGALNDLTDVVITAAATGEYLRFDGSNWVDATIQAGDVPTLNQNTTGSAATLTTTRTIWGQNFNGSANVTGNLTIGTANLLDANSNEFIIFTTTTSAVNELTLANAATGTNPKWTASGGDADVGIDWLVKGAGKFNMLASASGPAELRLFEDSDNGTNYIGIIGQGTLGANRTITLPDATGTIVLNDNTATLTNKSIDASQLTGTVAVARLTNIKQAKGITIVSPTASENATIFYTTQAITIEEVRGVMLGTSQSLTLVLNYGDTRDVADGTIVASIQFDSGETGYQTGGFAFTLNTSSIPAGNYIWLTTSATSGTINDFNLTITYRQ